MKKLILSALALPMALSFGSASAAPAAPTAAEKADTAKAAADKAKSAADKAKADYLYRQAANSRTLAQAEWSVANELWQLRNVVINRYQIHSAAANSFTRQAQAFALESAKLHQAEVLRPQATQYHYAEDARNKSAYDHKSRAAASEKAISSGNQALKDLGANAIFANAIADIKKDLAQQETSMKNHLAAAKVDEAAALKNKGIAADLEKRAAALEAPVVVVVQVPVVKPAAPAKVETPAAVAKEVAQVTKAAPVIVIAPAVAAPVKALTK